MNPNDGRVISNFIVQALKKQPLTIYGDGRQTRSFCYVDDLIEGMVRLMDSNLNSPVNIGNPEEFPIIDLANSANLYLNDRAPWKLIKDISNKNVVALDIYSVL